MTGFFVLDAIFTQEHLMIFFAYYIFAAGVGALEAPDNTSSPLYRWAFKFLNTMAANISRAFSKQIDSSVNTPQEMEVKSVTVRRIDGELGVPPTKEVITLPSPRQEEKDKL